MPDLDTLAERLMPRVLAALRERVPADAKALAQDAADVLGLDETCCSILADWLEDHLLLGVAAKVRRLAVADGDLIIVQPDVHLTEAGTRALWAKVGEVQLALEERGKVVEFILLPPGWTIELLRAAARRRDEGGDKRA